MMGDDDGDQDGVKTCQSKNTDTGGKSVWRCAITVAIRIFSNILIHLTLCDLHDCIQ